MMLPATHRRWVSRRCSFHSRRVCTPANMRIALSPLIRCMQVKTKELAVLDSAPSHRHGSYDRLSSLFSICLTVKLVMLSSIDVPSYEQPCKPPFTLGGVLVLLNICPGQVDSVQLVTQCSGWYPGISICAPSISYASHLSAHEYPSYNVIVVRVHGVFHVFALGDFHSLQTLDPQFEDSSISLPFMQVGI